MCLVLASETCPNTTGNTSASIKLKKLIAQLAFGTKIAQYSQGSSRLVLIWSHTVYKIIFLIYNNG